MSSCIINQISITKDWLSQWFTQDKVIYGKQLFEDFIIRKHVNNIFNSCLTTKVVIERHKNVINVNITCVKIGLALSKRFNYVDALVKILKKDIADKLININFKVQNNPSASAAVIVQQSIALLHRQYSFRRIIKTVLHHSIRNKFKGAKIQIKGRIGGKSIARKESFQYGLVPRNTFSANIDYSFRGYRGKYGVCGVKAWVYK